MAQYIRHQVNVACGVVQVGGKGAAELVRADFRLERGGGGGVFLHKVLHGALGYPPLLQGQKQGVLMTRQGVHFFAFLQIFAKRRRYLRRKIQHHLIAALAGDQKGVFLQIYIGQIDAHAL